MIVDYKIIVFNTFNSAGKMDRCQLVYKRSNLTIYEFLYIDAH